MNLLFIDPNPTKILSQNIGLAYVISNSEKTDSPVLLDTTLLGNNAEKKLKKHLREYKPAVVALSVTSFSYFESLSLSSTIKKTSPDSKIVWGGGFPTLFPEESIRIPYVDAVCIGEGEISFSEYTRMIEHGKHHAIPGFWQKDKENIIEKGPPRPFNHDLDSLPFPNWEYWEMGKALESDRFLIPGAIKFLAARGCPYNCSFCSNRSIRESVPGKYYRTREPEKIIEEISYNLSRYVEKGFKTVHFADEIFGLDHQKMEEFCALFKKSGLNKRLSWCCATRPDVITAEWAETAAHAGCSWIWLGVESGDSHIRNNVYKKDISDLQIIEAVNTLRNKGIVFSLSLMIGCPDDTLDSIDKSITLVKRLKPGTIDCSFFQPLPKTELGSRILDEQGMLHAASRRDWNSPLFPTKTLTIKQLKKIMTRIRLIKIKSFALLSLKKRGPLFFFDIVRYILKTLINNPSQIRNPLLGLDIQLKILYAYKIRDGRHGR